MAENSDIKAKLKISLFAGNMIIAESEDTLLWEKVFSAIAKKGKSTLGEPDDVNRVCEVSELFEKGVYEKSNNSDNAIVNFAKELGISQEELQGACTPMHEAPYIHLDGRYWEAFVKNIPARGPGSVSRIGLAGTLLCLWFNHANIAGQPTMSDCQAVLNTIRISDSNPTRSLNNSPWLQKRGSGLIINPAQTSRAAEVAKTYCTAIKATRAA